MFAALESLGEKINVMAATIHYVVGAISKLATHSIVHIETQERSKRMIFVEICHAMTNFSQECAPFWDVLNASPKLKTAADEMQKELVMTFDTTVPDRKKKLTAACAA